MLQNILSHIMRKNKINSNILKHRKQEKKSSD